MHPLKRAQLLVGYTEQKRIALSYIYKLEHRYRRTALQYFHFPESYRDAWCNEDIIGAFEPLVLRPVQDQSDQIPVGAEIPDAVSLLCKLTDWVSRPFEEVCPHGTAEEIDKHFHPLIPLYYYIWVTIDAIAGPCNTIRRLWSLEEVGNLFSSDWERLPMDPKRIAAWARLTWPVKKAIAQGYLLDDDLAILESLRTSQDDTIMNIIERRFAIGIKPQNDSQNRRAGLLSHVSRRAFTALADQYGIENPTEGSPIEDRMVELWRILQREYSRAIDRLS